MRSRRRFEGIAAVMLTSGVLFAVNCGAQSTPKESLLVLSKHDHTLSIVDPATLKVVGHAPVGEDPHEVAASWDGKTAYVSIYGGGRFHTLSVIDLIGQKALPDIDLGLLGGPHGLDFAGDKLWFTAEGAKVIGSYDPSSKKVDWIMGTGQNRTHMIYVTKDQKQIYTTNVASGTVSIWDLKAQQMGPPPPRPGGPMPPGVPGGGPAGPPGGPGGAPHMEWNQTVIKAGAGDEGFDVSPDGRELWAANAQEGTISVIDIAGKRVLLTIAANVTGANRLKFTPDGKMVLVSLLGSPDLVVLDAQTRMETKRVKIGSGAAGILMEPDGSRAFVACTPDSYVAVIDLKTLEVVGKIEAGGEPDGLAWAVQR